ncbi:cytochrome b [Aeromonas veronii]
MNPSTRLSLTTRLLHWSVASLMIGLTLVGYLMVKFEIWDLYALHKSLGVIALILILPRAILCLVKGSGQDRERFLSRARGFDRPNRV